ncbi:MAG: HAD-IC family P-type ATPase [archaeon]|nr:HAD-IC family P-type ATPase [archaeon]
MAHYKSSNPGEHFGSLPNVLSLSSSDDDRGSADDFYDPETHLLQNSHSESSSSSSSSSSSQKQPYAPDSSRFESVKFGTEPDADFIWTGYKTSGLSFQLVAYWLCVLLTGGVLLIFTFWLPHLRMRLSARTTSLDAAEVVVVSRVGYTTTVASCLSQDSSTMSSDIFTVGVRTVTLSPTLIREMPALSEFVHGDGTVRLVDIAFQLHAYSRHQHVFVPLTTLHALQLAHHQQQPPSLNQDQRELLTQVFGANFIKIPLPSVGSLLLKEILHPFYIFQIVSIVLWLLEDYWGYAVVIFVAALISTVSTVYSIRKNAQRLRKMAAFDISVRSLKFNHRGQPLVEERSSQSLVPGDIIYLADGMVLPCDLQILGSDANVLVNEALLTGESVPVAKMSYSKCVSDIAESLLYGGTTIIQSRPRGSVRARVLSTGFQTAKGVLMRSILAGSASANASEFTSEGYIIVAILFGIALIGVAANGWFIPHLDYEANAFHQSLDILDVITIAVPPALPVALSAGISFALTRLRRSKVYCISPSKINLAGQIELVCFDKTGTLTLDDLELNALMNFDGNLVPIHDLFSIITSGSPLFFILAACHSLMKLEDSDTVVGDPLELKMFRALGPDFSLDVSGPSPRVFGTIGDQMMSIEIVHRFPFASALQRMSCLLKVNNSQYYVVMKGSPEMIVDNFCSSKTVGTPWNTYTRSGFRVLASAIKHLPDPSEVLGALQSHSATVRDVVETPHAFDFAGCLIFENALKDDSTPTIRELARIGMRSVMITGDHPLTALHVAKECSIIMPPAHARSYMCNPSDLTWQLVGHDPKDHQIPHFSMTEMLNEVLMDDSISLVVNGLSYAKVSDPSFDEVDFVRILRSCNVFARMKPDQKASLVGFFQSKLGIRTAMVGDGSNDCSALKQADVGLSLSSEAEATMAAPFTSSSTSPASLLTLFREGRAALVTSMSAFKYIVFYSMIQFWGIELLYFHGATFGNWHFLLQDLFAVLPLAILMSYTHASSKLSVARPPARILSLKVLTSLISQILLQGAFQIASLLYMRSRDFWSEVIHNHVKLDPYSWATTTLFNLSMFLLVFSCLALSIGRPFRKEFWSNYGFVFWALVVLGFELYLLFGPTTAPELGVFLQLFPIPTNAAAVLCGMGLLYGLLSAFIEFLLGRESAAQAAQTEHIDGPHVHDEEDEDFMVHTIQ